MSTPHRPFFDWRLSFGNLISILILVFGMAASWYALKQEQALQSQSLDMLRSTVMTNSTRIEKVEVAREDMRERLIRLEIGQSQQSQILREVRELLKERSN